MPPIRAQQVSPLLGVALLVAGCGDPTPKAPEVRPVRTVVVEPRAVDDDRRAVGEVKPRHESDLGFRVAGKVVARPVDVGTSVRRGAVLARLDEQDYRNKLRSAEADLLAARAVLIETQGAEARQRQLLTTGVTTRASYDAALRNLQSAEAKQIAARAAVDLAKDQLRYTELHAEFDGVVTAVGAEPGQIVDVGRMVVRLAEPSARDAVFTIAESRFAPPAPNERPNIVVTLLSNPEVTAEGTVREISPVADPVTRTYQIKVALQDPPERMRFGASVVGRPKVAGETTVVLPGSVLFDKGSKPAVWVVDPAQGIVSLKPVEIARYETDRVFIGGGLAQGDIVVTAGVNRLRQNQKVRLAGGGEK